MTGGGLSLWIYLNNETDNSTFPYKSGTYHSYLYKSYMSLLSSDINFSLPKAIIYQKIKVIHP